MPGATQIWGGNSPELFEETQGRRQAGHYHGFRQLEGMRRQAQGRQLRRFDGTGATGFGETLSIRDLLPMSTPGRRGMLLAGGVAGAEPPHKGGPNRPNRPKARREWRGVRRESCRFPGLRVDRETVGVPQRPEAWESSPPFWDGLQLPCFAPRFRCNCPVPTTISQVLNRQMV